jgi:membrane protein DedA with SNARE-associated domain
VRKPVKSLLDHLLSLPGWVVLVVAGGLVFAEDALFVGFVVPGETVAVLAGVAANLGHVSLVAVLITVVAAAIIGDSVGYELGRTIGPRLLAWKRLEGHRKRLDEAQDLLARRGGVAVFLGRFVAFFRAVMPALAGTSRMPYFRFLAFNALGGIVWGVGVVLIGYLAGASYAKVEKTAGRGAAVAVAVIVIIGVVVWRIRKHRAEKRSDAEPTESRMSSTTHSAGSKRG